MTIPPESRLGAVVLAGGRSARMGEDKALLRFGEGRLIDHVVETLRRIADPVVVVARHASAFDAVDARVIEDERLFAGPLPALVAGLRFAETERAIAVACDMPFLDAALLSALAELAGTYDAAVPQTAVGPEPLHAAYAQSAVAALHAAHSAGERSLRGALTWLRVRWVPEDEWRPLDLEGRSFVNVNTPEEFAAARAHTLRS